MFIQPIQNMFIQPCFIRKNTKELRDALSLIGYEMFDKEMKGQCLLVAPADKHLIDSVPFATALSTKMYQYFDSKQVIDCGENEDLFLALAALQDDTDENQWFFYPKEHVWSVCYDDSIEQIRKEKADSCKGAWFHQSHKATVAELIEHFTK